jgi:hypothetical protein
MVEETEEDLVKHGEVNYEDNHSSQINPLKPSKREQKQRENVWGRSERHFISGGGERKSII